MEHSEILNNDIIDQYLLHYLTEQEESEFEEHLLFCADCQAELEKRKALVETIRKKKVEDLIEPNTTLHLKSRSRFFSPFTLKIAASIAIFLSVFWIFNEFSDSSHQTVAKKISTPKFDISAQSTKNGEKKTPILAMQTDDSFKEMPMLENLIENQVRAERIEVIAPRTNQEFALSTTVNFEWKGGQADSLNLVIFDNKAQIIFVEKISRKFRLSKEFKKGLYYWQLETYEESLFVGKFKIGKNSSTVK